MTELTLTTSRRINAPMADVFDAWLNPEMLARFMIPGEGMTVPKAEADPKVGGRFSIIMKAGDQEIPHAGTYQEIDPHSRLVFTWESPFSIDGSTVTLNLQEAEGGGTDIELVHVRFPDEESRNNHMGGWNNILEKLDSVMA